MIDDSDVRINEIEQDLESMKETKQQKDKYEREMADWKARCEKLKNKIQEEKYRAQIEQAKQKRIIEKEY